MEGADYVTQLIIDYRYWILIPLTFIEGPIVAFIAGTLASLGYFNVYVLGALFLVRDIAVDLAFYYLGFFGSKRSWVKKVLYKLGVRDDHLDDVRKVWHKHPGKTMFFSKLSYGVAAGFIVVAGMIEMPIRKFLFYGSLVAIAHYITLLAIGYLFGVAFGSSIAGTIENIPYVIGVVTVLFIVYYFFRRYMNKKLEEEEQKD